MVLQKCSKMISNKNISITLNKKYKFSKNDLNKYDSIVYTRPIDAFLISSLENSDGGH